MKSCYRIVLLLLLTVSLFGCGREPVQESTEPGTYQIYYLNASQTKLVPREYHTATTDTDLLVEELIEQIKSVPPNLDCQPAFTDKVGYQSSKRDNMVLYLYFDNNYTSMKSAREIMCRAALAKTLTQIEGVDFINIYSGDQPLLDLSGNPVGMMAATDFIDNISDVNAFVKTDMVLYFTDETGERLIPEKREVVHSINTSLEKVVLQELISGPKIPGLYSTLPKDVKVLNLSVNENVCYINFDSAFLTSVTDIKEYIPIYSITNSLSELSTVNKVQLSVNGSQEVLYRDLISLNTMFERNLDYIGGNDN